LKQARPLLAEYLGSMVTSKNQTSLYQVGLSGIAM
jgi:hypothetical protein